MSGGLDKFMSLFLFDRERALHIGVERERFLTQEQETVPEFAQLLVRIAARFRELRPTLAGKRLTASEIHIVPESGRVLKEIAAQFPESLERFAPEFNECVLEDKIGPCPLERVRTELERNEGIISPVLESLGLGFTFQEVAPTSIPFAITNSERFKQLLKTWSLDTALAVSRITGTHIHVGMPDHDMALRAYNRLVRCDWRAFLTNASSSEGRRERLYRRLKPGYEPVSYDSWEHFYEDACAKGFDQNPKDNWAMIRLSSHGTVEIRVFGAAQRIETVCTWAWLCHELCAQVLDEEG